MTDHDRELGAIAAKIDALEKAVEALEKSVTEMRDVMMMGKGLSRVGAYAGAVLLVVLGAIASQFVAWAWPR